MNSATLHVKVSPETAKALKELAKRRGQSVGELVRNAVTSCYQTEMIQLPISQRRAVDAYLDGYISLGKLSEKMGMHVVEMREWLVEQGLNQSIQFAHDDISHA